jgi:ligand-binding sensor domain-containing protein
MRCFDLTSWQESELAPEPRKAIEQSESSIMSFFPGRSGKLWCLLRKFDSRDNSLMLYDGQKWTGPIEPKKSRDSASSRPAHANIGLQDSEGYVWLPGIKVVRFDERKNEWKGYPEAPHIFALSIYEDRKGRIWIGGADGDVCVYDKALDFWTSHKLVDHLPKTANKNDFDRLAIDALYQDRDGQMMFGTRQGLFILSEAENKWELVTSGNSNLPNDWIHSISEDRSGRIWIGTSDGVVIVDQ